MFSITTDSYIDPTEVKPYIVKVKVDYHNELFKERIKKLAKERHLGLIVFKDMFDGLFGLRRINTVISSLFWCERWKPINVTPLSDLNDEEFKFASNRESTIFCKSVKIELERFLREQQNKFEHLISIKNPKSSSSVQVKPAPCLMGDVLNGINGQEITVEAVAYWGSENTDELPCLNFAVNVRDENNNCRQILIQSDGDGCIASKTANNRRRILMQMAINLAQGIAEYLEANLHGKDKVKKVVSSCIEICGLVIPEGFVIPVGNEKYVKKEPFVEQEIP